jgi:hypothetical protein
MLETRSVETASGMVFDVSAGGRDDAPLVLMLHGFGVSRFFWLDTTEVPALPGSSRTGAQSGSRR